MRISQLSCQLVLLSTGLLKFNNVSKHAICLFRMENVCCDGTPEWRASAAKISACMAMFHELFEGALVNYVVPGALPPTTHSGDAAEDALVNYVVPGALPR
jgi:hypothetical protein